MKSLFPNHCHIHAQPVTDTKKLSAVEVAYTTAASLVALVTHTKKLDATKIL